MKKIMLAILLVLFSTSSCANKPEPTILLVPDDCKINAGEDFSISLDGSNLPSDGVITWSATKGTVNPQTGFNVIYTPPQESGPVIITAVLEAGDVKYSKSLKCDITAVAPTENVTVVPTDTPSSLSNKDTYTIAITEVMAVPCGGTGGGPNRNEYVELYNYGTNDIDIGGWWVATGPGGEGTPDLLTSWASVNPGMGLGESIITNTTVIPPNHFAVILSPKYYIGQGHYFMPYKFPEGTIILTVSQGDYLGNDGKGLLGTNSPLSTLVLYTGTNLVIDRVISTYGTPSFGSSPNNVQDDSLDNFPYPVYECTSMERVVASGPDVLGNWREVLDGNPGAGNYLP